MSKTFVLPLTFLMLMTYAAAGATPPDAWQAFAVRPEIAPKSWIVDDHTLALAGNGLEATDGRWQKRVPVEAGRHYGFSALYKATGVETPGRSVLARVIWFNDKDRQVEQAEYPTLIGSEGEWNILAATYAAPKGAASARLELHLRWTARGEVIWKDARLIETSPSTPRKVRVASVNHRPRGTKSVAENLEQFARHIDEAANQKADIVCLPEGITVVGTRFKYAEVAEPVPGPSTEFLGQYAKKNNLYVVAGIYEREDKVIYNTSVLIGRDGKLVGKYRKVCLPREEIDGGITPGKEYPVFDADFGRIGMMICWDLHYPEVARELAQRGAEVIFMPIWGGNETLAKARAIENQIHLVASGYDFPTTIYDRKGEVLAQEKEKSGVIVSGIDLNERVMWPWLGDWRSRIWREAPVAPAR
jgi:predicted amidohydrolase